MKKSGIRILTIFAVLFPFLSFSQWEAVYHGADSTNEITGISFYTATEGYIASGSYIGYTQDGGKSFQKKTISFSNVNFNGYGVNLTFGFTPAGITALAKDRLLVYGDYGLEPAILYSADAGNTFKLVYHKNIPLNTSNVYNKVREMRFYNSTTGYAIQNDEIIKTTDGGQTWTISLRYENLGFADLSFPDATTGYAVSRSNVYKMNTSWGFWSELPNAPAGATKVSFVSSTTGYLHCIDNNGSRYYKTTNGGANWIPCSTADLRVPSAEDMEFVSETTGFVSTEGYQIFKTTDGGKSWELCKGSNTFTYLNYGFSRLFFYNGQTGWAGGYHDYLAKTTTGGDPTFPNARFKINKASFCTTGVVQLENHSRSGYNYQWYLNGSLLSTSYNASYSADASPYDTIRLVVSNGVDSDTAEEIVEAQAFGQFTFTSRPESDTACTEQGTYILIPNSDPNTYYTAYRGNIGDGWGYGNGGLLKLKCQYSGNSALIQYRVDATRTTACGTERKTNYHDIYFYSPLIDVAAKADTVCSDRQHFVTVTNSLWGYEYWVDSTKRVPGNGGVIKLPFTTGDRYTGYYPFWGAYATLRLKIFARHATWGCRNVFPRAEVDAVIRDPWAYAVAREYEYKTGQTINIQNNTIDGHSYVWRTEGEGVVNNGTTLFEPANLSFTQPGTYRINLYDTSKEGCTDTASTAVQVVEASSITRRQMEVCKTDTLQSEYYYKATDSYKDASGNLYITGAKMKLNYHFSTKGLEGWF
ncbi:MAG: hypothetical protein M3Q06_12825, partial [Bacteroidota bacterium]|nr:hypothetical protein [Bacteroidota bacterium]